MDRKYFMYMGMYICELLRACGWELEGDDGKKILFKRGSIFIGIEDGDHLYIEDMYYQFYVELEEVDIYQDEEGAYILEVRRNSPHLCMKFNMGRRTNEDVKLN